MPRLRQATKDVRVLLLSQSTRGLAYSCRTQSATSSAQGMLATGQLSRASGAYRCGLPISACFGVNLRITINEEIDERSVWGALY